MAKAETVVESVKMSDGRVIDFPGKKRLQKESFVAQDGTVSTRCDFRNGESLTFSVSPDNTLYSRFAGHGIEQKLGDETAGVEDLDDAVLAVSDLIDRLNKGEWGVAREGNGMAGTSVLLQAIVKVTGKPLEAIKQFLSTKTQPQKMALRNSERFADAVKEIEAEKASKKAKVDISGDLAELDALAERPDTPAAAHQVWSPLDLDAEPRKVGKGPIVHAVGPFFIFVDNPNGEWYYMSIGHIARF